MNKNILAAIRAAILSFVTPIAFIVILTIAGVPAAVSTPASSALALLVMLPAIRRSCTREMLAVDAGKVRGVLEDLKPMLVSYAVFAGILLAMNLVAGSVNVASIVATLLIEGVRQTLVGIYEESMFRGVVLERALAGTKSKKSALVLSAALFAIAHVPSFLVGQNSAIVIVPRMLALLVFGIALGLERFKQESIAGGAVLHTLTNVMLLTTGAAATADVTSAGGFGLAFISIVEIASLAKPTARLWRETFAEKSCEVEKA